MTHLAHHPLFTWLVVHCHAILTHFFVAELTRDDATLAKLVTVDFVVVFALRALPEHFFFVLFDFAFNDIIALNAFD
jgi:hypothetical protein